MSSGRIRVGIGGWTFPPWRGVFYPDKWPQSKELDYASQRLGVIEINATFYSRQSPKSWEKWGATAPDRVPVRDQGFPLLRHSDPAV